MVQKKIQKFSLAFLLFLPMLSFARPMLLDSCGELLHHVKYEKLKSTVAGLWSDFSYLEHWGKNGVYRFKPELMFSSEEIVSLKVNVELGGSTKAGEISLILTRNGDIGARSIELATKGDGVATAIYQVLLRYHNPGEEFFINNTNKETIAMVRSLCLEVAKQQDSQNRNFFLSEDGEISAGERLISDRINSIYDSNETGSAKRRQLGPWVSILKKLGFKFIRVKFQSGKESDATHIPEYDLFVKLYARKTPY